MKSAIIEGVSKYCANMNGEVINSRQVSANGWPKGGQTLQVEGAAPEGPGGMGVHVLLKDKGESGLR